MDWLQFFASIIGNLAWPATVAFCVWLFRTKLVELLPNLRLKHNETEISFRIDIAEAEAAKLPQSPAKPAPDEAVSKFRQLVEISPSAGVFEAWLPVEAIIGKAAEKYDLLQIQYPMRLMQELRSRDLVDEATLRLFNELRVVRNSVVHSEGKQVVSASEAMRFKELSDQLIFQLTSILDVE